jgi:hypothetical protein
VSGTPEVDRHLDVASALLEGRFRVGPVPAMRAACWFTRRGLEALLPVLLSRRGLQPGTSNTRTRLICLAVVYADQADRANDLVSAWDHLSRACHHHAYELTPTLGEARDLLTRVQSGRSLT